ncbi:amino acid ABC transporter substrate-binding protein [Allorhizobium borbori]|uniref:Glutamate/aspartate transport system substrate-binding protein n=1 Tax=Allorhizobium borbori TaxID=485907 RepID=A0A7W6K0Y7_9HYPH|nr:amino acid ABC transporter substrate-binding protein [Allorhizobium borbori]MBB4102211.1 glutamate/aspartate transport system substrate-binding protein [Allorhizobium borbori]
MPRSVTGRQCALGLFITLVVLVAQLGPALAQAPASTLERIRREGTLRIGYGQTPPFSYRTPDGTVTGYSIDICLRVADDLKRQLGLERLEIVYVRRTAIDRVPLLNEGQYDLECEASTNTQERRRSAAFALGHFFTTTRFVALAKNDLHTIDALKGRSLAVALGTVNIGQVGKLNRDRRLQASVVTAETISDAFDLVTSGRASAFAMDDILLEVMVKATGRPEAYQISSEPVSDVLPYGFMMRRNDTAFHDAVNAALRRIYASPDMGQIYDRWFRAALPGLNLRLDVPMGPQLSAYFASFR